MNDHVWLKTSNGAAENLVLPQQDKKIHLKYIKIEK